MTAPRAAAPSPIGRRVLVCHGSIVPGDAIGNDIAGMVSVLSRDREVCVFGEYVMRSDVPRVDRAQVEEFLASPDHTIVYHHSIEWPLGEELLRRARARVVIKYHNITPEDFFVGRHAVLESMCRRGREQTARLRAALPDALWLGDSAFNLVDAGIAVGPNAVVPPFHVVEDWRAIRPSPAVLGALVESPDVNLLAVGRLVPNKGLHTLVDAVAYYRRHYGPRIRLNVVGGHTGDADRYRGELLRQISSLGLDRHVRLLGPVAEDELLALYLGSDYFLCGSEHEGFCVPVIEAQSLRRPVIARDIPAVRETAGDAQLLLGGEPAEFAEAIALLESNPDHRRFLVEAGAENFARRFSRAEIERRLCAALGLTAVPVACA